MKPVVPQHRFLRNSSYPTNKTCLISVIAQCFGDADKLIVSTALEVCNSVLVVATDIDILAMMMNYASGTHGGVYVGRGMCACGNVLDIQEKIGVLKTYHALSGCDSVSVLFSKGKKIVLNCGFGEHQLYGSFHQY